MAKAPMEIWLKHGTDAIQIPVLPSSFTVSEENGHQTVNVQTKGDVTILGKRGLRSVDFTSFFPDRTYPFSAYPKKTGPYWYVRKLESWAQKAIRLTITDTNINMLVTIQSFSYGEPDPTGDIEYSLSLKEYRHPSYTAPKPSNTKPTTTDKKPQPAPKTYVVKKGDHIRALAKKFYGDASKYTKIYNANKTAIENAAKKNGRSSSTGYGIKGWWIYPGTKLVIPA